MNDLPVQPKDARDLEVGDYVQVIAKGMPLTVHPDLFRRIEHIGIPTDPANTLTYVWCHGVSHCLALPQGDVEVWVDVPDDRRNEDDSECGPFNGKESGAQSHKNANPWGQKFKLRSCIDPAGPAPFRCGDWHLGEKL